MQPAGGTETNIKLPFLFIFFSLGAFVVSQLLFFIHGVDIIDATFRLPTVWSIAHLFILGWLLMLAMGAMYQLVPVAFLTKIWSETFGFVQFAVMAIGVVSFAVALYMAPHRALIPGIITVIGILMFLFQMGMTLKKASKSKHTNIICRYRTCLLASDNFHRYCTCLPFTDRIFQSYI